MGNAYNENLFLKFYDMTGKRVNGIPDPSRPDPAIPGSVAGEPGKTGSGMQEYNPGPVASDGGLGKGKSGNVSQAGSIELPANRLQQMRTVKTGNAVQSGKPLQPGKAIQSAEIGKPETKEEGFRLDFSNNSVVNALILSEVLGKPKFLQRRRW